MYIDLPPLVEEAMKRLPKKGQPFPQEKRDRWFALLRMAFDWDYPAAPVDRPTSPPAQDLEAFSGKQGRPDISAGAERAKKAATRVAVDWPLLDAADAPFVRLGPLAANPADEPELVIPLTGTADGDEQAGSYCCLHCGKPFDTIQARAGHKRWCTLRPGAAPPPAHITVDGDPVPISTVPPDQVPRPSSAMRETQLRDAQRAATVTAAAAGWSFIESLRWRPPTAEAADVALGHRRRPQDEEKVRAAGVDAALPRFGS